MKLQLIIVSIFVFPTIVSAQWIKQKVESKASLRGLSVVSEKIIWAGGTGGTVLKTGNGGKTWQVIIVPGAEKLDFRDIEAFDANTAYILSIGNGDASRIYKTTDGGKNWKLQFINRDEKAFYDAIACLDRNNCLAMSDPVDGRFPMIRTTNGMTWRPIAENKLPAAIEGEAAFAASGTCLFINHQNRNVYLVTGGAVSRVLFSSIRGSKWTAVETPVTQGSSSSGIFSIAFYDGLKGAVVGGDYQKPDAADNNIALTKNGGKSWYSVKGLSGYRSGVAFISESTIIAVGNNSSDLSFDGGQTWRKIGNENLNAVAAKGRNAVWAVGQDGIVLKLHLQ